MFGEITISGAKNAAVAIIPAALLVDGVCRIENIPQISDVTLLFTILEDMGAKVKVLNQHAVQIDCHSVHSTQPCYDLARKIRASYYLLGALLGRFGEATVAMPGGCNFGVRPIDQHVKGFRAMGADVTEGNLVHATARGGRLKGATVYLDVVSVGATMNIMMAAVLADGVTTIENAAKEPHIVDLANFLNSMGADIKGAGTDSIRIRGVEKLSGGSYCIIPDQIEAGTYMAAVAAAGGSVGILTDTGLITDEAADVLAGAALLMLESNHDEECLRSGPYPYSLKQRILGPLGHLSNDAAAAFAAQMARLGTREIVLAHLSRENNTPAMALERVGRALSGTGVRLSAAPRRDLGGPYIVEVSNAKGQHPLCGETEGEVLPRCSGGIQ